MMSIETNGPQVVVVAYDRLCTFEFGIAVEVFGLSRPEFGNDWYQFQVCSAEGESVSAVGGVQIQVDSGLEAVNEADIVVIPGWRGPHMLPPLPLIESLIVAHERGARIAGICGGVFVLAAAGLLSSKCATTHWMYLDTFIEKYPDVRVERTQPFCDIDRILTSAGSAAGIDLCLHIVRSDYGEEVAATVARRLVVSRETERSPSFENRPVIKSHKRERLEALLERLRVDIATPYSVEQSAQELEISPRTFQRRLEIVTGMGYNLWMTQQRLERAKTLLRETDLSIEHIAKACGLASGGSLRRIFREHLNASPSEFRKKTGPLDAPNDP